MNMGAKMSDSAVVSPTRIPVRDGLFAGSLEHLDKVRLLGNRCADCGETTLGQSAVCLNCGGVAVSPLPLGARGTLWTYTVVRHKPPGDYKGPEPFVPFAMGLVELPEGIRVLAPINCPPGQLKIGMALEFQAFARPGQSDPEVVVFTFNPAA